MSDAIERALAGALVDGSFVMGEIRVAFRGTGYILAHRNDGDRDDLRTHRSADNAVEIARFDDAGDYRPLKTAPNLRHGWRLELPTLRAAREALDYFYPGRLAAFARFQEGELGTTSLRETLQRQTGMYRVAANISNSGVTDVVGGFCRSDGGCLRTILWALDGSGEKPSTLLPPEKYDPDYDQAKGTPTESKGALLPLLCQEACNLLIAECRKVVRSGREVSPEAKGSSPNE
jgi:sirohydrochlorin cobaltochelatase